MNLVETVAQQLGWSRNRDEANAKDTAEAEAMVARWQQRRAEMGLEPFSGRSAEISDVIAVEIQGGEDA